MKIYTLDDDIGYVELIDHMGDDNRVVESARVSYLSESTSPERDAKLINYLMKHHHTSPFEHVVFTFKVKCPLFVRSQWHRHRTWSYNEISRRYTSEDIQFYMPYGLRKQGESNKQASTEETIEVLFTETHDELGYISPVIVYDLLSDYTESALSLYNDLLSEGVAREQARMVLPQNLYTTFYGTVSLHNLFKFFDLRSSPDAQKEIRVYSEAMERLIEPIVPVSYKAWKGSRHDQQ